MQEEAGNWWASAASGRRRGRPTGGQRAGYCVVMGQKVPMQRPRVRTTDDKEVRCGQLRNIPPREPLPETVWEKLMLGLRRGIWPGGWRQFIEAYGLEKSAVSEHFIEASGRS